MTALTQPRWRDSELTDALILSKAFQIGGKAEENGKRTLAVEREWFQSFLNADRFIRALCQDPAPFRLEEAGNSHHRDSSRIFLTGDPRLGKLYSHWLRLIDLERTPRLRQHLVPNIYMRAFLEAFTVCQELQGLIGDNPIAVPRSMAKDIIEALNTALAMLQSKSTNGSFRCEARKAKRASDKNRLGLVRYLDKLFDLYSPLLVVRLDLGYRLKNRDAVDLEAAKHHLETMLEARHFHQLFDHWVGYAWKLEYGPIKGLHTQLLLFFDSAEKRQDVELARALGEFWADIATEGKGMYFDCNADIEKHYHANTMDMVSLEDSLKMEGLRHVINSLTKIDDLVRLQMPDKQRSFGRGTLRQALCSM